MASKQSTVDFILEQIACAGVVSARRMFGEYGLYCSQKFVGVVCDDRLYLKPTPGGRALLGGDAQEASPYPGAKPHFLIPGEAWDDAERLTALVKVTAAELPTPASKTARKPNTTRR